MGYYNTSIKQVLKELKSSEEGLSEKEAQKRLDVYGKNILVSQDGNSLFNKFFSQFKDLMIFILLIAAAISFALSVVNKEPFTDSIVIVSIVILNAILGFVQEVKADKSIKALNEMQVTSVKVMRDGKVKLINSENLVKGDIILLESGDKVPADSRIIGEHLLRVNESSLTGESIDITKEECILDEVTPLHERTNMVYSGTYVVYGKCKGVVCETGSNTEFGLIAKSLNSSEKDITPLQKKINDISKVLSIVILAVIGIIFVIGLFKGFDLLNIFMLSISLAVAAIPEGLPAVITITLSLGINDLASKKAIVRRMSSVETLGCTEVICSDKTGTITQNKMQMREIYYNNKMYEIKDFGKENPLIYNMILNNDVQKEGDKYIGDPTELALYEYCEQYYDIVEFRNINKRVNEIPFDSDRKMMSTLNLKDKDLILYVKGSFDSIIKRCTFIYENGKVKKLSKKKKEELRSIEITEANKAYRMLAYAYKKVDDVAISKETENNLIFTGMTAVTDLPRPEVYDAVSECKKANIKTIMITGDSLPTAISVAKDIGIIEDENEAILGSELEEMGDNELIDMINNYSVFARVSPTCKLKIVDALKKNNKVVAMTGDGVNDAPALKTADIGIGMGINGTDVSKEVSDIVLADDSFSTIVVAVKEGRRIYDNIRNVLVYLLTGNAVEILCVFVGMIFGVEIFLPIQLLYINLITDSIPAIALSFEKEDSNIMTRKIRKKDSSFFTPFLISKITISAILKTIAVSLVYFLTINKDGPEAATTMAFLTLILLEVVFAYSCKNLKKSVLNKSFISNKSLNRSIILLIAIQLVVFLSPIRSIFSITNLSLSQIGFCFLLTVISFIIDEVLKKLLYNKIKD